MTTVVVFGMRYDEVIACACRLGDASDLLPEAYRLRALSPAPFSPVSLHRQHCFALLTLSR